MSINIIVACDLNNGIGKQGSIPWKSDLAYFKEKTLGCPIVMGRKTWESFPDPPLDGRLNIIVSTGWPDGRWNRIKKNNTNPSFYVCKSLSYALEIAKKDYHGDIYIIGGTQLYRTALDKGVVDKVIMTRYYKEYGCDRFFPVLDPMIWRGQNIHNDLEYTRIEYQK